jgi:hypothetical protein
MQLEIKTEGVDFMVSRAPHPKNDNNGRQKTDRETGAPLCVTELVAMDKTGAEVIKVTTARGTEDRQTAAGHGSQAGRHTMDHRRPRRSGLSGRRDHPAGGHEGGYRDGCVMTAPTRSPDLAPLTESQKHAERLCAKAADTDRGGRPALAGIIRRRRTRTLRR